MADKTPKPGDPALFYGKRLEVFELDEVEGVRRVKVVNADGERRRAEAIAELQQLRERQAGLTGQDHADIALQIAALDAEASRAVERFALRADLLSWWEERGVWVSEGRILSDDQIEAFRKLTGAKPRPDAHRDALRIVEALEG